MTSRPRSWAVSDLWLGLALLLLGYVAVLAIAVVIHTRTPAEADATLPLAVVSFGFTVWLGAAVLIIAARRDLSMRQLGFTATTSPVRWVLLALVGAWALVTAWNVLVQLAERASGTDLGRLTEGNLPPTPDDPMVLVVLGLSTVVAAPLAEELFFRGFLFGALRERMGVVAALVLSGLVFGLVHIEPSVIVPFWAVGALFAWIYHRSGSLWTTIGAHAIFNGIGFIVIATGVFEDLT